MTKKACAQMADKHYTDSHEIQRRRSKIGSRMEDFDISKSDSVAL